ncbi:MAG: DUF512 domain-containing protein [Clostridia bacterium]|nr:DUF512 domain-containing protein [Clostridia bacterium]
MSVEIKNVKKWSACFFRGIRAGDRLVSVNGNEINDFLDYDFYLKDEKLCLEFEHKGKPRSVTLKKAADDDIGLEFESYLMDKQKRCRNKCIFCFIDQNPEGMRESIYFKDDDSRLSFLFGNYITLTNLSDSDIDRIIKMHISPVNVSVHTMNRELRVKMMNNKNAGKCLDYIYRLAEAGIELNTQLVLCPGINDGKELEYSITELGKLFPAVQSIAAVPVGITKHREGLFNMPAYTKESAGEVIDIIERLGDEFKVKHGTRLVYAADEFYLKAQREIPDEEYYESYPQIENGVGMWTSFRSEADDFVGSLVENADVKRCVSLATGTAAYPLIKETAEKLMRIYPGLRVNTYEIKNDFYGHSVTVAGLVTGGDLINQLKDKELGEMLIIPDVMLRSEGDLFLDNVSLEEAKKQLGVEICTVRSDSGFELIKEILNLN